jgi:hypothetical protein
MKELLCSAATCGFFFLAYNVAVAAISGSCVTCHTMHNSQDGNSMTSTTAEAQNQLLRVASCIICHMGETSEGARNATFNAPIVFHTDNPITTGNSKTLAGGSFYWVADAGGGDDYKGHNVLGISSLDGVLGNEPPGHNVTYNINRIECTSCHIANSHHDNVSGWVTGSSGADSYRFLSGGIKGGEDTDYEYSVAYNDHNVYFCDTASGQALGSATQSIQDHCALCHGIFHNQVGSDGTSSPWVRHPTDISLNGAGPVYSVYNTYDVIIPLGSSVQVATDSFTHAVSDTQDIVTCMSCHRAHGSEHDDMLRFSYETITRDENNGKGCYVCHSTIHNTSGF